MTQPPSRQTKSKATERDLLDRVLLGQLHVCHETLTVSVYHRRKKIWIVKTPDFHKDRARFRFGENRNTVYRNRLVFIYFNKRIPIGFVDHIDEDRTNDHPSNLADQDPRLSHKQGERLQQIKHYEECAAFFDSIAFTGEIPNE